MRRAALLLVSIFVVSILVILGCEQQPTDSSNATVVGYVYHNVEYTDSVFQDSIWIYTQWHFEHPAESVLVFVEGDILSKVPYKGPDKWGYTDSLGRYEIPVYLGHDPIYLGADIVGYEYVHFCDARVLAIYKGGWFYDFGGGITLHAGHEFRLWPICLEWLSLVESD